MPQQVERYLAALVEDGRVPGIQYARVEATSGIIATVAGWADLRQKRRMTIETPMMAYSMSKLVTAAVAMQLSREGQLGLDDLLCRYLPWQPYGDELTIRQLLEHRSGIPNPLPLRWVHLAFEAESFQELAALNSVLREQGRLRFKPGAKRLYSNIGYWLLGQVIEQVAGGPLGAIVESALLAKIGIERADIGYRFPTDGSQAKGYLERLSLMNLLRPLLMDGKFFEKAQGRWVRIEDHYVNGPGYGGCIGTALGFCKLAAYLMRHHDRIPGSDRAGEVYEKEGGGAGFRCRIELDLHRQSAHVLMANATTFDVASCMRRLREIQN